MSTTNEKYREDLTAYLLEAATGNGYLKGALLNTPSPTPKPVPPSP